MSEPFLGEIQIFGFNFAPRGWSFCDGQLLPIAQNQSLFSILGTTYGGNATTSFALPDMRGRAPMHVGDGRLLGQKAGAETVSLTAAELPSHSHTLRGSSDEATSGSPDGNLLADVNTASDIYGAFDDGVDLPVGGSSIRNTGGGQAHDNMQPFTTLTFCIALQGLFPPRN